LGNTGSLIISGRRVWWQPEFFQQHCQGLSQLEPVAGVVCEDDEQQGIHSGFERGEPFVLFPQKLQALDPLELSLPEIVLELLSSLLALASTNLDVVCGSPVEHRQQALPGWQGGYPFQPSDMPGVCGSG